MLCWFLVLIFVCSSLLLCILELNFLGLSLLVVYVGAIIVLFLFVCMMLNIKMEEQKHAIFGFLPVSAFFVVFVSVRFIIPFFFA